MLSRLAKLVQHMCGQDSGLLIALYCREVSDTIGELDCIAKEIKTQPNTIITHNDDKILLMKYDHVGGIRQGWIHGGQPNGVIFYDSLNVDPRDIVYAASRVHQPRGLFKDSQVVSLFEQGAGLQSVVSTFHADYFVLEDLK